MTGPRARGDWQVRRPRSTVRDRQDVLRVLGVLKVATATQIMQLVRPHLSDNKAIRNALRALQADKLVLSEGSTAGPAGKFGAPDRRGEPSQKLWGLTPGGLDAAAAHLQREPEVMGGRARGAGAGGAPHAMAVNNTIVAFTRGGTLPGAPAGSGGLASVARVISRDLVEVDRPCRRDVPAHGDDYGSRLAVAGRGPHRLGKLRCRRPGHLRITQQPTRRAGATRSRAEPRSSGRTGSVQPECAVEG